MAVKLSEVRNYHKIWKSVNGDNRYKDWFNGKQRIYLDIIDDVKINKKIPTSATQEEVLKILAENGYDLKDYAEGIAIKPENHKNEFKIGRLLNRFNKILKNKFDSDSTREGVKLNKSGLKVVISKHPADIIAMSTYRGWTSCMELHTGANRRYITEDIKEGTLIAYLIRDTDLSIKNPVARCLIKPYTNTLKEIVLVPENRIYGTDRKGFRETIDNWINKHQTIKKGIFQLNKKLYNDGKPSVIMGYDKSYTINSVYGGGNIVIVYDNNTARYGMMNKEGNIILEPNYVGLSPDYNCPNFYRTVIRSNNGSNICGGIIVTPQGEILSVIEPQYYNISAINDEYFLVSDQNNYYGVIDMKSDVIIPIKHRNIQLIGGKKDFIFIKENSTNDAKVFNLRTKEVAFEFKSKNGSYLNMISDKPVLFSIMESRLTYIIEYTLLNVRGEIIIEKCNAVNILSPTQISVRKDVIENGLVKDRVYAIFDIEKNKYITDFVYSSISKMQMKIKEVTHFFYRVSKNIDKKKIETILDVSGNELFKESGWEFFNSINGTSMFVVGYLTGKKSMYERKSAILDMNTGEFIIPFEKDYTWFDLGNPYKNGLIISYSADIEKKKYKYGVINHLNGVEVLKPIYESVKVYATGICFKQIDMWGFVNNKGEIIVEPTHKLLSDVKRVLKEQREIKRADKLAKKKIKEAK